VAEAEAYASLAKAALRQLPPSVYRDALNDLADFCVSRAH
jgi:octaprenyl-diphosphate synthase